MAGYSGTPLLKKLGVKPGFKCSVKGAPEAYFDWLSPLPEGADFVEKGKNLDFIHIFVKTKKEFEKGFLESKKVMVTNGMLWVSWPKRASKIETDLDENIIRDYGLKNGLVDVKVCAVDEVWSGLKFVVRVRER